MEFDRRSRPGHPGTSATHAAPTPGKHTQIERLAMQGAHASPGAARDERGPDAAPVDAGHAAARDAHGRITAVSVEGGRTKVVFGLGWEQGVFQGAHGYVRSESGDGMLCSFEVHEVHERRAHAYLDTTYETALRHTEVVVNPSSMPASAQPRHDFHTRVIARSDGGGGAERRTQLRIGGGERHGVRVGMRGYLTDASYQQVFEEFEVVEVHPGSCIAYVDAWMSAVDAHSNVVLNPSR